MRAVGFVMVLAGIFLQVWKRKAPAGVTTATASGQPVTGAQPTGTPGTS